MEATAAASRKAKAAEPKRIPLVILFAETRGFTRTSAILPAPVVLARVSEFFAVLREAIERQGGVVRSLLNDTLMASFDGEKCEQRSVMAAQEIQERFAQFEESWEKEYGIHAAVAIGIHSGETVVGVPESTGAIPMLIGDNVSIADRLLHRARAGEFVMSGPVFEALAVGGFALDAQELPDLEIPRRDPIPLFGVIRDTRLDFT